MRKKKGFTLAAAFSAMLLLIFNGQLFFVGIQDGMLYCFRVVIPSLFPFILLSGLVVNSYEGPTGPLLRAAEMIFRMPSGSGALLIPSFLGGYPLGAQFIGREYRNGRISRSDAERLLMFCNQPGPAFIFGMIMPVMERRWMAWGLWGAQIFGALVVSFLLPAGESVYASENECSPNKTDIMKDSLLALSRICGWVVIFRALIAFFGQTIFIKMPSEMRALCTGLMELTNGCAMLRQISNGNLRFLLAEIMLSFGGLCVTLQTASVAQGLSMRKYMIGKLCQTLIGVALVLAVCAKARLVLIPVLMCSFGIFASRRKKVAFSR